MSETISRRDFLTRTERRRPVRLRISCERLYMKYADANAEGRLPAFLADLARELSAVDADEILLSETEWLARDDFRADVEHLLARHASLVSPGDSHLSRCQKP